MTQYSCSVSVPYTAEQMQTLVADVKSYPAFISWIKSLTVRNELADDTSWKGRAQATVGFKGFSERFTTDVSSDKLSHEINVHLVSGPFRHLENQWKFESTDEGCEIKFFIDFEFSNFILKMLLKANFERAVRILISIFTDEAHRRYGKNLQSGA